MLIQKYNIPVKSTLNKDEQTQKLTYKLIG